MFLYFLSFYFYEIWPFKRLMNDTIRFFSGAFIPLSLFPKWLKGITDILPFRYLYSFPIEIILSRKENISLTNGFFSLLIWDVIMVGIVYFILKLIYWDRFVAGMVPVLIRNVFLRCFTIIFYWFFGRIYFIY